MSSTPRRPSSVHPVELVALVLAFAVAPVVPLAAQPGVGPAPVGVTEARAIDLARAVELTGSVEAVRSSVVASEVAGLVVELAAREGRRVGRGAPLVRLRRQTLELDLEARRADLAEAEARLELAAANLERARRLFAEGIISRERLEDAVSEETAWRGRADRLRAQIARVEDDLERSVVRAPFTGVVVEEHTEVGEWVAVGAPVAELVDLSRLEVALEVPESSFAGLEVGSDVPVRFDALPGRTLEGEVSALVPRADPRARTFPVKVRIPNTDGRLGVGMLARVELSVGATRRATVVPKDAVVRRGERTVVYRVGRDADGQAAVSEVAVTPRGGVGVWIAVDGAIAPGDRVVTRGNERLSGGQAVETSPVDYGLP